MFSQIFYFVGFGLFCLESILSVGVLQVFHFIPLSSLSEFLRIKSINLSIAIKFIYLQQVYMYFRGSGKAAQMRQEAARGAMRAAF